MNRYLKTLAIAVAAETVAVVVGLWVMDRRITRFGNLIEEACA